MNLIRLVLVMKMKKMNNHDIVHFRFKFIIGVLTVTSQPEKGPQF